MFSESSLLLFKVRGLQITSNFTISVNKSEREAGGGGGRCNPAI